MDDVRRYVGRQFSLRGLSLNTDALSYLTEQIRDMTKEQRQRTMGKVLELVEKENVPSFLNLDTLKEMLKILSRHKKNESEIIFKLENAFEWQKQIMEDRKRHSSDSENFNQLPFEQLGYNTYLQRFELVKQLLEENLDSFASIDSLLTHRSKCVRILAQIYHGEGTEIIAEDHSGKIRLDLTSAEFEPCICFEGGVFVFEGQCSPNADCLQVGMVALPRLKTIELTEMRGAPEFGKKKDPNDRIVFMSDVHLDNENVMRSIYEILQGFSTSPPNIFVFCGPFLTVQRSQGYTEKSTIAFRHLANIINQFSTSYQNTFFVLVPSLEDPPPLQIFPCPPLPPNVQKCFKDMRNVHFATNPCRLIFKDQQILIYRDNILEKLSKSTIHMPKNVRVDTIPKLFCDTIWSQRHFSPLPLFYNPVQPHFDALFQLWPAPDLLVLADKFKAFAVADDGRNRLTINPGPFTGGHFEFQVYYPSLKRVDQSKFTPEDG